MSCFRVLQGDKIEYNVVAVHTLTGCEPSFWGSKNGVKKR